MKLVFDVGGTSVKFGVADEEGNFSFTDSVPTPKKDVGEFLQVTGSIFEKAVREHNIDGVAFSFPGEVHSREGVIKGISAVEYLHEIPLKSILEERFGGLPVTMANDANCAAMGELWKGVAKECQSVVFVICGTGIGGAVIERGKLDMGVTMNRGEFGNFPMGGFKDGVLLSWSNYTLERQAQKYNDRKQPSELPIDGIRLDQLSREGDILAEELMEEFYYWMAMGCITLEFAFDPELIAIGGGISSNPEIIDRIQKTVVSLLKGQRQGYLIPRITACTNGSRANLYGALYYHLYGEKIDIE
ncbi:MAG: ROK family protein [Hungatella sp.]|nr:ROK family protein [Hungatella sp.]